MTSHAYVITPKWARYTQKLLYLARYFLLGLAGTVALATFAGTSMVWVGWVLILFSCVAGFGVLTGRFQFELVAIWFLVGALIGAVGVLVGADRMTSAILVLALVPALIERLQHLILVAKKARTLGG